MKRKEKLYQWVQWLEGMNEWLGKSVAWLTTVLVLLVCYDVISRRIFNASQAWVMELEWHFFALIFLFGAGYTLKHDQHVRVDLFYAQFSKRDQAWINLMGHILFLVPWCFMVIWVSFQYGIESWRINESSPDPGGLPARYLIKFAIPIGIAFLLLQSFAVIGRSLLLLRTIPKFD